MHGLPAPPPPGPRGHIAVLAVVAAAVLVGAVGLDLTADGALAQALGLSERSAQEDGMAERSAHRSDAGPGLVEQGPDDVGPGTSPPIVDETGRTPVPEEVPVPAVPEDVPAVPEDVPAVPEDVLSAVPDEAQADLLVPEDDRALRVPGDGEHDRRFTWSFQGASWTYELSIPDADYQEFRSRERPLRMVEGEDGHLRMHAYDLYVSEPSDDAFVDALAARFVATAEARGWDDVTRAAFVLSFVQSLPYTQDNATSAFDEYPRFPVETLVDEGGDCEDTAILLGALLAAMGHDVALLAPPGHMALGLVMDGIDAPSYEHDGKQYHFVETTGEGWGIGDVPPEHADATVQVFSTAPTPLLEAHVDAGPAEAGRQRFTLEARNLGTAQAEGAVLRAFLQDDDGLRHDERACTAVALAPGATRTCHVWLDLGAVPTGVAVRLHVEAADGERLHDRLVSRSWTPRSA